MNTLQLPCVPRASMSKTIVLALIAAIRRLAPVYPLQRHTPDHAAVTRERNAALSGIR